MVKQKDKLNIMIDDISDEGVDFNSIEPVEDLDDEEKEQLSKNKGFLNSL